MENAAIPSPIDAVPEMIEFNRPLVGWGHKKDKEEDKKTPVKPKKEVYTEKSE